MPGLTVRAKLPVRCSPGLLLLVLAVRRIPALPVLTRLPVRAMLDGDCILRGDRSGDETSCSLASPSASAGT